MNEPAIKGHVVHGTVDLLKEAIANGRISTEVVTARLEARDLRMLDEKIESSLWYPADSLHRISELLMEELGKGRDDYDFMVEIGRSSAERFRREGVFAAFIREAEKRGDRMLTVLIKLAELALNFGEWSFEGEIKRDFSVTVRDCSGLSDTMRYSTLGFIETLACELTQTPMKAATRREKPDVVVYRCWRAD